MALPDINYLLSIGEKRNTKIRFIKDFPANVVGNEIVTFNDVPVGLEKMGYCIILKPVKEVKPIVEPVEVAKPVEVELVKPKKKKSKSNKKDKGV